MVNDKGQNRVRLFYDADPEREWTRASRHRTEFALTWRVIRENLALLSESVSDWVLRILDIGGGPGYYSRLLQEAGHEVTLLDLAPANIECARRVTEGGLAGYHCGTATDLGAFDGGSFEAVLLLGPLYHLLAESDRRQAVAEACRVLTPGGLLFASFITVFAPLRDMAKNYPEEIVRYFASPAALAEWVKDGRWPYRPGAGFTDAHFIHPAAIRPLMEAGGGLVTEAVLAVEGVVSLIEDRLNQLPEAAWEFWADVNYRLASEPSVLGGAEHILYVGRKTGRR